jgi:hypothetical protein
MTSLLSCQSLAILNVILRELYPPEKLATAYPGNSAGKPSAGSVYGSGGFFLGKDGGGQPIVADEPAGAFYLCRYNRQYMCGEEESRS